MSGQKLLDIKPKQFTARSGFVYLMGAKETHICKIGCTAFPDKRLRKLTLQSPYKLNYLGYYLAQDMYAEESYLHRVFARRRLHGEWFKLRPLEELTMLGIMLAKGYRDMVEMEIQGVAVEAEARRRVRNLDRRIDYKMNKMMQDIKAGRLEAQPRSPNVGMYYYGRHYERLQAAINRILDDLNRLYDEA